MKLRLAELTLLRFTMLILFVCDIIAFSNGGIQLEPVLAEPLLP